MEEWSNYSNCSHNLSFQFDSTGYKILAGLRAGVGLTSALCCLAVIIIIILFKQYKRFSQRLILNIAVAAFIHSLSYTTGRVNFYTLRSLNDPYCKFAGLFIDYAGTAELISIWFAVLNIFSVGFFRKNISGFEKAYYILTYLIPSLWWWVPVWLDLYGTSGGWCAIFIDDTCDVNYNKLKFERSLYTEFGLWFVPLFLVSLIMIVMLISVLIKVCCCLRQRSPTSSAAKKLVLKEIRPLALYPTVYLLLNSFSVLAEISRAIKSFPTYQVLEYLHIFTSDLRGAFIALVFTCNRDTRRLLRSGAWQQRWRRGEPTFQSIESTTVYEEGSEEMSDSSDSSAEKLGAMQ